MHQGAERPRAGTAEASRRSARPSAVLVAIATFCIAALGSADRVRGQSQDPAPPSAESPAPKPVPSPEPRQLEPEIVEPDAEESPVTRSAGNEALNSRISESIEKGLSYLARRQERQGSWSNVGGWGEYPVAMTAMAGLAFLMDGNTTTQGRYAPQVDRATTFLLRSVNPNGLFARGEADARPMHGHGFATLFLSQVYGVTEDKVRAGQIHEALTKAIKLTGQAQSTLGGWLYTPDARADEGSVTVTQIQGLRGCRNAGIAVPKSVIDQAMEYLTKSLNEDGGIRYTAAARGPSRPALTAAALVCWFNAGQFDNPLVGPALQFCKDNVRPTSTRGGWDFYAHLYMSQALWVSSSPDWDEYYRKRADFLIRLQREDGSWEADNVGDIYGTSIALIILQLPFQQLPIMQR